MQGPNRLAILQLLVLGLEVEERAPDGVDQVQRLVRLYAELLNLG